MLLDYLPTFLAVFILFIFAYRWIHEDKQMKETIKKREMERLSKEYDRIQELKWWKLKHPNEIPPPHLSAEHLKPRYIDGIL